MSAGWVDLGFLLLWSSFPFKVSFSKSSRVNLGWVDVDGVAGDAKRHIFPKKPLNKSVFWFPQNIFIYILSIVLRTCPGTALVKMNSGWQILGSCFPLSFLFIFFSKPREILPTLGCLSIYLPIYLSIYRYRDSLVKSPQWEPSVPQQLNTNVIRGACESCTTSVKRAQLLANVDSFYEFDDKFSNTAKSS